MLQEGGGRGGEEEGGEGGGEEEKGGTDLMYLRRVQPIHVTGKTHHSYPPCVEHT